ncbi:4-vinyl reductase [Polyangium sp. y55x31]|uniref:4-vinyl reductase n=1 Tax=Polyangium sp. y55x31 TaxID=3042688 RepID=UPI0024831B9D|nr:4-vinyl reductase [Polyangium sp. y55x31]MDI1482433.1 4-vinyl reductase [Polyangium sp. y55x31]
MSFHLAPKADLERGITTVGGRRLVFHCHHYNVFLQRTIEDALQERAPALLVAAGMEASRSMLQGLENDAKSAADALELAADTFAAQGFGRLDVRGLGEGGGRATLDHSHYAVGWVSRWGKRPTPGCFFVAGFLSGAVAVAYRLAPERVTSRETECVAAGDERCSFRVEVW